MFLFQFLYINLSVLRYDLYHFLFLEHAKILNTVSSQEPFECEGVHYRIRYVPSLNF